MLRKHRSGAHPELKKKGGRPRKADKKSRAKINRDYWQRKKLTVSVSTSASTNTKPRKKRPAGFAKAEPSYEIGAFSWLPVLSPAEALERMGQDQFWEECIEHNLDPLWAYRYISWRLHHPRHAEFRLLNDIPGTSLPT